MAKHSQNNTAKGYHTHAEKVKAGYGSVKQRLGKDSLLQFGQCGLRMTPAENPVCTPEGVIFSRDAIIEHLAHQKISMKKQQRKFEKQQAEQMADAFEKQQKEELARLKTAEDVEISQAVAPQIEKEIKGRKVVSKNVGFWVPLHAPTAEPSLVKPPSNILRCPVTNKPLKLKELVPLKLEWEPQDPDSRDRTTRVMCSVTRDPIVHQKAVALKSSGIVMLESCLKDLVLPTMTCPVTGVRVKKKDIIKLVAGQTGFSAHNEVEAKKYQMHNSGAGFAGRGTKIASRV